ncbi:MAG: hypothetical protein V5A52_01975 [Halovenus sp.]|uniref:DUF7344 domain-containing protein n=1 Tax=Halovenus amylolytica TaxID=2500550 RepID=UPI000FE2EC70
MTDNEFSETEGDEPVGTIHLDDDELYRALASRRRRRLLYMLLVEEESTVQKLATVLAGWGATETGRMATPEDRRDILTALEHHHLPLLAESDLITYDRRSGVVSLGPVDQPVADLISRSVESERQQHS